MNLVKANMQTGAKTALNPSKVTADVTDAAAPGADVLLVVANRQLIRYDITANKETPYDIGEISHIKILPDGRWLAGSVDRVLFSDNEGSTWTEVKEIFSKVNPQRCMCRRTNGLIPMLFREWKHRETR